MDRREFIGGAAALLATGGCATRGEDGGVWSGWKPGEMDIHFIHTGVGEQTFFIFPDATTMLLDCGHVNRRASYVESVPPRPSAERRGGEWVARYLKRVSPTDAIDWVVVSHWHDDHVLGLGDVAKVFPFRRWLDHQYPEVGLYNRDADGDALAFARAFIPSARRTGMKAEPLVVGGLNQIALVNGGATAAPFEIRTLASNGVVWDGRRGTENCAAAHLRATDTKAISENRLSNAFRIRYGAFTYYTGGDVERTLTGADGKEFDWEAKVGRVCGPVDVCKTNHHAFWKAMHEGFVREIRAKAYLSSVWSPNQVTARNLPFIASRELYPGPRRIYHGALPTGAEKAKELDQPFRAIFSPAQGHQVVKVAPGGASFRIFTLTAEDESMRILAADDYRSGT